MPQLALTNFLAPEPTSSSPPPPTQTKRNKIKQLHQRSHALLPPTTNPQNSKHTQRDYSHCSFSAAQLLRSFATSQEDQDSDQEDGDLEAEATCRFEAEKVGKFGLLARWLFPPGTPSPGMTTPGTPPPGVPTDVLSFLWSKVRYGGEDALTPALAVSALRSTLLVQLNSKHSDSQIDSHVSPQDVTSSQQIRSARTRNATPIVVGESNGSGIQNELSQLLQQVTRNKNVEHRTAEECALVKRTLTLLRLFVKILPSAGHSGICQVATPEIFMQLFTLLDATDRALALDAARLLDVLTYSQSGSHDNVGNVRTSSSEAANTVYRALTSRATSCTLVSRNASRDKARRTLSLAPERFVDALAGLDSELEILVSICESLLGEDAEAKQRLEDGAEPSVAERGRKCLELTKDSVARRGGSSASLRLRPLVRGLRRVLECGQSFERYEV